MFRYATVPIATGCNADTASAFRIFKRDIQPVLGKQRSEPVGPFDQANAVQKRIFDPQFIDFFKGFNAVEVKVINCIGVCLIALNKRECRARYIFHYVQGPQKAAGEDGFAGAEIAPKGNHVATARNGGDVRRQARGRRFVSEVRGEGFRCHVWSAKRDVHCVLFYPARTQCGNGVAGFVRTLDRRAVHRHVLAGMTDFSRGETDVPDERQQTDIAIVGAGPVGLFAVFECGMLGLSCHVIDTLDAIGGQCTALYPEKPIYDIPGYPVIDASQLIERLREQAAPFAPIYHLGQTVTGLSRTDQDRWCLTTSKGQEIEAAAVVIAAGTGAFGFNRPPLDGIEAYEGKSVFYLVARREDFRAKRLVIAGGGDSAVDWTLALAGIAAHITLVHRRAKFRAAPESVSRLNALVEQGLVELATPFQLSGLEGEGGNLDAVMLSSLEGDQRRVEADVLLPFYGLAATLGPITDWGLALDRNVIPVNPATCETNLPGVHAIGDIADYPGKLKLILTGFAEAAAAAHAGFARARPDQALHFEYSTTKGLPGDA